MKTPKFQTAGFSIAEGILIVEPGSSRQQLKFVAPAARLVDGGFEASVAAVLFDADRRPVARTSSEYSRFVLSNRAAWTHEFDREKLAQARHLVYEIAYKVDYRRKLLAGELPELPVDADGNNYWKWLVPDARALDDAFVKLDVTLWAGSSAVDIVYAQVPRLAADLLRSDLELSLLDGNRDTLFARNLSMSPSYGARSFESTSCSMDRKTMRSLHFFELRGRTECRATAQLALDDFQTAA